MTRTGGAALRGLELWLSASVAEAERLLPDLLDVPAAVLRQEFRERPELRTAGMMQRLTTTAQQAVQRYPSRARELTFIAVRHVAAIAFPPGGAAIARRLEAQAWTERANALRVCGETREAHRAARVARRLFAQMPTGQWHLASVDLVEAAILRDLGERHAALALVRHAASTFVLHRDRDRYLEAQLTESWMLWADGDTAAAAEVWRTTNETARQWRDGAFRARLASRIGLFELRHGDAGEAWHLFSAALTAFDAAGLHREATRTRWSLAETAAARGRANEAISEYHKVRAELLAAGDVVDAAIASVEILALLLVAGRDREVAPLAETLIASFREAGMAPNALQAFLYLRGRNAAGEFTASDATAVRRYFEDLVHQPNAAFIPPD